MQLSQYNRGEDIQKFVQRASDDGYTIFRKGIQMTHPPIVVESLHAKRFQVALLNRSDPLGLAICYVCCQYRYKYKRLALDPFLSCSMFEDRHRPFWYFSASYRAELRFKKRNVETDSMWQ